MQVDESKRLSTLELKALPFFSKLLERSPLKKMEMPIVEKNVLGSQRVVGPVQTLSQQTIQKHNFLVPKEEISSLQMPHYRGQENKKSKSPING
jgi:hypothetical protein